MAAGTLAEMLKDVDASALATLLDLQAEDSAITRLQARRAALPEAQRLADLNASLAELASDIEIARKQRDDFVHEQTHIEGEMGILDQKIAREEGRLFSGGVSNPRELGALQAEVAMLKNKRGEMEDALLEAMVHKDEATATLESLEDEHRRTSVETDELAATVGAITGDLDAELASHSEARARFAAGIPESLLSLYEQLRDSKGGVGAAALRGHTCEGCHTELPAREVERLRAEGGLQRCDHCRRILVVT